MKTCKYCGAIHGDDAFTCEKCGGILGIIPDAAVQPVQQAVQQPVQPQIQQPQPQQQFQQLQQPFQQPQQPQQFQQPQYAQAGTAAGAVQKKGISKKVIIIICAVCAAVAVTVLILFLFVFKSKKDLIIGTWAADGESGSYTRFNKDGTVELELGNDQTKAVYEIDGDSLIIKRDSISLNYKIEELTEDKMTLSASAGLQTKSVSFTKVNEDAAVKSYTEKSKLKTANTNAKLVFTTLNNEAADRIADGESVAAVHTDGAVAVSDFEDSSDPLLKAVYKTLTDSGEELGYVYIDFDPNYDYYDGEYQFFVQWSESADGAVIGQYPNPVKSADDDVKFGKMHSDQ